MLHNSSLAAFARPRGKQLKMFHPNTDQQKDASGVEYMFKKYTVWDI
jgi:hypothetical protein